MDPNLEFAEEWLPVVGYEGFYLVSNLGRVQSLPRFDTLGRPIGGHLMRLNASGRYLTVYLFRESRYKNRTVHSLVAEAFIGPRPRGRTVDHVDGNKHNNSAGNLEYISQKEQITRAIKLGNFWYMPGGEKNANAKLSNADAVEIRRLALEGMPQSKIAKQFGIAQQSVSRVVNKKRYKLEGQE